jgi:peptidoglycan/LPS O-acetylase OafA/YrhL
MTKAASLWPHVTNEGGKHERQSRIAPLDGWRTISVALVVFSHLATNSSIAVSVQGQLGRLFIMPLLNECGSLGVEIFFVISGYVITGGLIREYEGNHGQVSLRNFYLRRAFRILPPLVIYVLVVVLLAELHVLPDQATKVAYALTFTCNLDLYGCGGWFGGHTWSLSYEEQFYLVIPLLFALCWRRGDFILLCTPFLLGILTICFYLFGSDFAAGYFGHFLAIAAGVAWATRDTFILRLCSSIPRFAVMLAPFILVAAVRAGNTRLWPVGSIIVPSIIILMLVYSTFISTHLAYALSRKWLTYFGRVSYGIYLWQQLATYAFVGAGLKFYLVSVIACLFLAATSYRWIEAPLIRASHSLSSRPWVLRRSATPPPI